MSWLGKLRQAARAVGSKSIDEPVDELCPENLTMLEAFEWYCPNDGRHWRRLQDALTDLKAIGIDNLWIPPGSKCGRENSNGYDVYDLYDLGEFEQKESRRTKWGTKEELISLTVAAKNNNIGIYWDTILNHRAWADRTEMVTAVKVDPEDRRREISRPEQIEAWVKWDFPARGDKYSAMKYTSKQFNGIDYDHKTQERAIFKLVGPGRKGWAEDVGKENGNADFLLCANYELSNPEVREDLCHWGEWISNEMNLSGMRLDAVKHFSEDFLRAFLRHLDEAKMRNGSRERLFIVGEYAQGDADVLSAFITRMNHRISLFDFTLQGNLARISWNEGADLREVLDNTLTLSKPEHTVTFVTNHDTQEREQDWQTRVKPSFHPHAYALILLRHTPSYPCVFYGDLYGTLGPNHPQPPPCSGRLPRLILARKLWAYGEQRDYFDESCCIGWTRTGDARRCGGAGLAVLVSTSSVVKRKRMFVGGRHRGERWADLMGWTRGVVIVDNRGWGDFSVAAGAVAVWADEMAVGREKMEIPTMSIYK